MAKPGTFKPGSSPNPGGMTAVERAARDAMRQWLATPELRAKAQAAYERLLDADNPLIVKDATDRLAGKVREHVELTGQDGAPLLPPLTSNELREYMDELKAARLEREKGKP